MEIENIISASCAAFGASRSQLESASRKENVNYARKCVIRLLRDTVKKANGRPIPFERVAEIVGLTNHSSAVVAYDVAGEYMEYNRDFQIGYTRACEQLGIKHNVSILPEPRRIIPMVYGLGSAEGIEIGSFMYEKMKAGKRALVSKSITRKYGMITRDECLAHVEYVKGREAA